MPADSVRTSKDSECAIVTVRRSPKLYCYARTGMRHMQSRCAPGPAGGPFCQSFGVEVTRKSVFKSL